MAYRIVENNAVAFADNRSIKFPRFQRKQTWDERDNFKLCISVFKGYPIGVVIINSVNGNDYLLDGRQRRNALKLMKDDPKAVYVWAKKFVGFQATQDIEAVKSKFWSSIDEYLQHEAAKPKGAPQAEQQEGTTELDTTVTPEEAQADEVEQEPEVSYNFESQYNSLKSLLDLIALCHPLKANKTNLQKMYEFNGIIAKSDLDYAEIIDGDYVVNSVKLKKYIDSLIDDNVSTVEDFSTAVARRHRITGQSLQNLKNYIQQHWEFYEKSLKVIEKINDVLNHATVGMISLTNADILDAQNIFSLVNASGTPLSSEELLSARPYWNAPLSNPSPELIASKNEMYKFLGIDVPEETCRWDLCSTFLKRIDKNGLIFENKKNSFTTSISLSYRIISALIVKGINNTSVMALEKPQTPAINWEVDIENYIKDLNLMITQLENINLFKYVEAWNQSVMSLTSNSIAIEFCALLYQRWKDLGKPTRSSAQIHSFNNDAAILFDRLVYEYGIRLWTGSGDSMVAAHLKRDSIGSRFVKITEQEWKDFIDEIESGQYKGKPTSSKTLKPFLYYGYFLRRLQPTIKNASTTYDIDHLVAQKFFKDYEDLDQTLKDNFLNFSILPKGENIEKTDKRLNEIHDRWLIDQIKKYAQISDADIEALSDFSKLSELKNRKKKYVDTYSTDRNQMFLTIND